MKFLFILLACYLCHGNPLLAAESGEGQKLFQTMCSRCHKLPQPGKRTPAQWEIIIGVMQQIMSQRGKATLTDSQKQQLLLYLENNSRQVDQEQTSVAKDMFVARCTLCHQLPEPGMLKPAQWKIIIQTMQQRMQQKDVPQLNEEERQQILRYLQEHSS